MFKLTYPEININTLEYKIFNWLWKLCNCTISRLDTISLTYLLICEINIKKKV